MRTATYTVAALAATIISNTSAFAQEAIAEDPKAETVLEDPDLVPVVLMPLPPDLILPVDPKPSKHKVAKAEPNYYLTYVGIGVGSLGLVLVGIGAGFTGHAQSTFDSIKSTTPQVTAKKLVNEANSSSETSNLILLTGGGIMAVGAFLVFLDAAIISADFNVNIQVENGGASAALKFHW